MNEFMYARGDRFERIAMIEKLTPEQEALIPFYREKWCQIMYSTEPIDREKAADAVKEAYLTIDEKEPKIIFCGKLFNI